MPCLCSFLHLTAKSKFLYHIVCFATPQILFTRWGEAAVWLQRAECEAQLGKLEEAEQSYTRVVALAPHVYQARLQLSLIMRRLGRAEDALDALKQDEQAELLNPHLMYERCTMLLAEGKTEEFINKSILLLYRHFVNIRNKDEQHAISSVKKMSSKNRALHEVRTKPGINLPIIQGPYVSQRTSQ